MIVQSDLPIGDDLFTFGELTELIIPRVTDVLDFVRMDTD